MITAFGERTGRSAAWACIRSMSVTRPIAARLPIRRKSRRGSVSQNSRRAPAEFSMASGSVVFWGEFIDAQKVGGTVPVPSSFKEWLHPPQPVGRLCGLYARRLRHRGLCLLLFNLSESQAIFGCRINDRRGTLYGHRIASEWLRRDRSAIVDVIRQLGGQPGSCCQARFLENITKRPGTRPIWLICLCGITMPRPVV